MSDETTKTVPSGRELDLMEALWTISEGTVSDVRTRLAARGHDLAYNTVQTLLNRLVDKGHVTREKEGRAFLYRPVLRRPAATGRAVRSLLQRFFGGSPEALVKHLVESNLEAEELDRLQRMIEARSGEERA